MNSRSTSPPRTCFSSQMSSVPFSFAMRARMSRTSAASLGRSRGFSSTCADRLPRRDARSAGGPEITRARVSARCSQVQASLGLVVDEARKLRGDGALLPGRAQAHVDLVERALGGRRDEAR